MAIHPSVSGTAYVSACEQIAREHGGTVWEEYEIASLSGSGRLYLVYLAGESPTGLRWADGYAALSPERAAYKAAEAAVDGSGSRCPSCERTVALSDIADLRGPDDTESRLSLCWLYYSRRTGRFTPGCRPLSLVS